MNGGRSRTVAVIVAGAAIGGSPAWANERQPAKPAPAPTAPSRDAAASAVSAETDALWARLAGDGELRPLAADAEGLFMRVAATAADKGSGLETLTLAAGVRRVTQQIAALPAEPARGVREIVASNRRLAMLTALSVAGSPEGAYTDDLAGVYRTLAELIEAHGAKLREDSPLTGLAAACAVVFDERARHPTHGQATITPVQAFGHFAQAWPKLAITPDRLPVRLLTWTAGLYCSPADAEWAVKTYAGRIPSDLFATIDYDTAAYKGRAEKKVLALGPGQYTLANIRKVGGVCTEQGYFASEVRKSLGIPAAYIWASGKDISHVWTATLHPGKGWATDEGREAGDGEYEELTGVLDDPQTREEIREGELVVSGLLADVKPWDAAAATALLDAAERLGAVRTRRGTITWPPAGEPIPGGLKAPRKADVAAQLALMESAGRIAAGDARLWRMVGAMGQAGELGSAERRKWADLTLKLCGRDAPDFAFEVLGPMFRAVKPAEAQAGLWDWAAGQFRTRTDLVGRSRIEQARAWEAGGQPGKAYDVYAGVIRDLGREGRIMQDALAAAEKLLVSTGKLAAVLGLYEEAFKHTRKPEAVGSRFLVRANYIVVGKRLAELYREAGRENDAQRMDKLIADASGRELKSDRRPGG